MVLSPSQLDKLGPAKTGAEKTRRTTTTTATASFFIPVFLLFVLLQTESYLCLWTQCTQSPPRTPEKISYSLFRMTIIRETRQNEMSLKAHFIGVSIKNAPAIRKICRLCLLLVLTVKEVLVGVEPHGLLPRVGFMKNQEVSHLLFPL